MLPLWQPQPLLWVPKAPAWLARAQVGALVQEMVNRSSGPMFSRGLPPVQCLLKNGRLPSLCHSVALGPKNTGKPGVCGRAS